MKGTIYTYKDNPFGIRFSLQMLKSGIYESTFLPALSLQFGREGALQGLWLSLAATLLIHGWMSRLEHGAISICFQGVGREQMKVALS